MISRLTKHIEQLLGLHTCVVVPGLGSFMLELQPAYHDRVACLIHPTSSELRFNELLQHQDGLLAHSYSEAYGVSNRRARLILEEDVRILRNNLVHRRRVQLGELGTLSLNEKGRIVFEPQMMQPFRGVSYGLTSLALPQRSLSEAGVPAVAQGDYLNLRISKRFISWSAAAAVLVLSFLPWGHSVESEPQYLASLTPGKDKLEKVIETVVEVVTPPSEAADSLNVWMTPKPGHYYIIIATEKDIARAKWHYTDATQWLSEVSESSLGILHDTKLYRVSAANFAHASDAYSYVRKLSKLGREAWVYQAK